MTIPIEVSIGATVLQRYAVGDTIEARFKAIISRQAQAEGNWMTTDEDKCFRASVGALMMSYPVDSAERGRIESEMRKINQFSAFIAAAQQGLNVWPPDVDEHEAIGLLGMWRDRER